IDISMIEKANERIHILKEKYLDWKDVSLSDINVSDLVGGKEHHQLAMEVYRHSTTIVKNEETLPLDLNRNVLVIYPETGATVRVEDKKDMTFHLGEAV